MHPTHTLAMGDTRPLKLRARQTRRGKLDHFVEVVGHQAVSEDIPTEPGAGVDRGIDKSVIVPGLVKDNLDDCHD
jgi:hypothetical protein